MVEKKLAPDRVRSDDDTGVNAAIDDTQPVLVITKAAQKKIEYLQSQSWWNDIPEDRREQMIETVVRVLSTTPIPCRKTDKVRVDTAVTLDDMNRLSKDAQKQMNEYSDDVKLRMLSALAQAGELR